VQVWSKAEALGAPRGNYIGNLAYYAFGKSAARWLVSIGSFSQFVNDDCSGGGSAPTPAVPRPAPRARPPIDTGS
jgi:hypothetical protein